MGRKKIVKSALTAFKAVVRPIITFIDEEESECLLHPAEPLRLVLHKSKIEQDVASLKLTASNVGAVALAANQIESSINAFVMNRRAHETTGNWLDDIYNKPEDYQVYLGTKLLRGHTLTLGCEQNLCFPFFKFGVRRYYHIVVEYKNLQREVITRELQGFPARVFQHYIDQLRARSIIDWRVNQGDLRLDDSVIEHFPKTVAVIQEYSREIKAMLAQYPGLGNMPDPFDSATSPLNAAQEEAVSIQQDLVQRITKHFRKEYFLLSSRIDCGLIGPDGKMKNEEQESPMKKPSVRRL